MKVTVESANEHISEEDFAKLTDGLNVLAKSTIISKGSNKDFVIKFIVEVNTLDELQNLIRATTKLTENNEYVEGGLLLKSCGNNMFAMIYDYFLE